MLLADTIGQLVKKTSFQFNGTVLNFVPLVIAFSFAR